MSDAREAAFEAWAAGVIYNDQPLPERKGIPYFLASKAHAAGVAEGIRIARAEASRIARSMSDNEGDGYYGQACYEVAAAIDALEQND